jgi:small neutral amino acid transporter SnatA (MarC family)
LEALPVFLELAGRKDDQEHGRVARRACVYAVAQMFFFFIFGTPVLRVFGIPLSMVRIVGGIILTRLGFALFSSRPVAAGWLRGAIGKLALGGRLLVEVYPSRSASGLASGP